MKPFLDRTALLLGESAVERLQKAHFLVLGVGGVGGYTAEMLLRAGAGTLTLIDGDTVEESNLNRQLAALRSTLGKSKTGVLEERFRDIAPEAQINTISCFLERKSDIDEILDGGHFDGAADAIDTVMPKTEFILGCLRRRIPLVSSMGSGGRLDPEKITICDISETYNCGLARAVRKRLRDAGVKRGVKVVFSSEEVPEHAIRPASDGLKHRSAVGTVSYLPAVFGCFLAKALLSEFLASSGDENAPAS